MNCLSIHKLLKKPKFKYLHFNNARLKTEELVARIVYRHTQPKLLDPSSDDDLENMYEEDVDVKTVSEKVKDHLNFLLNCAVAKKTLENHGITQQDFKMLSFLYYHMVDTYGKFRVEDYQKFIKSYRKALAILQDKNGKYADDKVDFDFDNSARLIPEAFTKYLGAPHHEKKIKQTVTWLLQEFDIRSNVILQDPKRSYTHKEKTDQLALQDYKCGVDGLDLNYEDAEAEPILYHIITVDNLHVIIW